MTARATGGPNTGDTKAGTFIGLDKYGNKFYENLAEELPRENTFNSVA